VWSSNSFRYCLSFGWKRLRNTCLSDYTRAAIAWITSLCVSRDVACHTPISCRCNSHSIRCQSEATNTARILQQPFSDQLQITYCYSVHPPGKRLLTATLILLKFYNLKMNNALSTIEHYWTLLGTQCNLRSITINLYNTATFINA